MEKEHSAHDCNSEAFRTVRVEKARFRSSRALLGALTCLYACKLRYIALFSRDYECP